MYDQSVVSALQKHISLVRKFRNTYTVCTHTYTFYRTHTYAQQWKANKLYYGNPIIEIRKFGTFVLGTIVEHVYLISAIDVVWPYNVTIEYQRTNLSQEISKRTDLFEIIPTRNNDAERLTIVTRWKEAVGLPKSHLPTMGHSIRVKRSFMADETAD